jgi:hypothetical protein
MFYHPLVKPHVCLDYAHHLLYTIFAFDWFHSKFALFGRLLSGGEEVVEGVRFNTRLELSMKPIEHMQTMAMLDLTSSLANGRMALPLCLQAVAFFLQEDIGKPRQGSEAHDGYCAHQLVLIQAQFFFARAFETLVVPTSSDMQEQGLWISLQIDFWPNNGLARVEPPTRMCQN